MAPVRKKIKVVYKYSANVECLNCRHDVEIFIDKEYSVDDYIRRVNTPCPNCGQRLKHRA